MVGDILVQTMETFTLVGILVAAAIFTRLAIKAKSIGSFRFQLSIFILIWTAAEIPQILQTLGLISTGSLDSLGLGFHLASMYVFAFFVGARTFKYLRLPPSDVIPKGAKPSLPTGAMEK